MLSCNNDSVLIHPAPTSGAGYDTCNANSDDKKTAGHDGKIYPPIAPDVPVIVVVTVGLVLVAETGGTDAVDVAAVLGAALDNTVVAHVLSLLIRLYPYYIIIILFPTHSTNLLVFIIFRSFLYIIIFYLQS